MLSSKGDTKQEARFGARLDVLMERLDTLGSTVATTASAIAKKDGEIAALRRDLEARDQTLQSLVAQTRQSAAAPSAASVDGNELRSLRNAVAALSKRVEEGSASRRPPEPERPSEELVAMLATLRSQVEALGGLRPSVSEESLDRRFGETDEALAALASRLDALAETVESAASSLSDKEHELAALHRRFTESSTRVESIVEDIRDALHAFPEPGSTLLEELARRVERMEGRLAAVAEEVARAKTLWPVALRSLEARLDDAVHARRDELTPAESGPERAASDAPPDDLLATLRDSLQAMESVAAEMTRASETLSVPLDPAEDPGEAPAVAAGATIVPLRASEP